MEEMRRCEVLGCVWSGGVRKTSAARAHHTHDDTECTQLRVISRAWKSFVQLVGASSAIRSAVESVGVVVESPTRDGLGSERV